MALAQNHSTDKIARLILGLSAATIARPLLGAQDGGSASPIDAATSITRVENVSTPQTKPFECSGVPPCMKHLVADYQIIPEGLKKGDLSPDSFKTSLDMIARLSEDSHATEINHMHSYLTGLRQGPRELGQRLSEYKFGWSPTAREQTKERLEQAARDLSQDKIPEYKTNIRRASIDISSAHANAQVMEWAAAGLATSLFVLALSTHPFKAFRALRADPQLKEFAKDSIEKEEGLSDKMWAALEMASFVGYMDPKTRESEPRTSWFVQTVSATGLAASLGILPGTAAYWLASGSASATALGSLTAVIGVIAGIFVSANISAPLSLNARGVRELRSDYERFCSQNGSRA